MPQKKKTVKHAKTKNQGVLILAEKIEKEFRNIPSKLASLYRQEQTNLKQKQVKLQTELKNAQTRQNDAQKKQTLITKSNKKTPAAKKQLLAIKKALGNTTQTIKAITANLNQLNKTATILSTKQTKFTLLGKELHVLEKKLAKTTKPVVKAVKKSVKKTVKRNVVKQNKPQPTSYTETLTSNQDLTTHTTSTTDDLVETN